MLAAQSEQMGIPDVITDIAVGCPISVGVCHRRGVWPECASGQQGRWRPRGARVGARVGARLRGQKLAFLGSLENGKFPRLVLICPKSHSKMPQSFQVSSDFRDMLGLVLVTRGRVLREGIDNPRIWSWLAAEQMFTRWTFQKIILAIL